jgi:hypothetical protein
MFDGYTTTGSGPHTVGIIPKKTSERRAMANGEVRRFFSNLHVRGSIVVIAGLAVLWIFRTHLKELASVLWPIVVAVGIYGFRTELSTLLTRIRRVGKEGAEFFEARIAAQIMAQPVDVALKDVVPDETHPLTSCRELTRFASS